MFCACIATTGITLEGLMPGATRVWQWIGWRGWDFLEFMILYSNLIPISLYVTLELQKSVSKILAFCEPAWSTGWSWCVALEKCRCGVCRSTL